MAEDDLVHFVIEAVERLPLSAFVVNHKGTGDAPFPPHLLLALLIYSYANGVFGSRRIKRATDRDVAVRDLRAGTHPDHDPICTFRRRNLEAVAGAFVEVLELAREMKLLKLGSVSLDGTHSKASASKDQNVTYERAGQLRAALRQDVAALLAQAEASDREDADPQKLPEEIAQREKLLGKMEAARARLEARAAARAESERAEDERKVAARAAREGSAKGSAPQPPCACSGSPTHQPPYSLPPPRRAPESQRRMEPHLPGLQPQAAAHPAAGRQRGLSRAPQRKNAPNAQAARPAPPPHFQKSPLARHPPGSHPIIAATALPARHQSKPSAQARQALYPRKTRAGVRKHLAPTPPEAKRSCPPAPNEPGTYFPPGP